ncbi:hypothetical protein BCR36DRAFT_402681 [Piromyces finnis]|uniref:HCP-like protein n=1 Tax=Piromyces finnis TaxID=1754191 RepID=A0A1Y1VGK8_9FUNG|nr:hypothetical protein BCR36DRAFT_402681 [Piromyces finnis]|eukprot:ORX55858.1 hypothetical protein BCR36DRAFT_402681 [Piromyces finnis]
MQTDEVVNEKTQSIMSSPSTPNTITAKTTENDTITNSNEPNDFNIEKVVNSIYEIKSDLDFFKLRSSVVATKNSEYIYRFSQGVLDIFFGENQFDNIIYSNISISQKNIIYDETLNLLLDLSNKNHALSQFLLGKIYYTRKIYYKSFRFFELALKNHLYDAAFYIGLFFEHGLGIDKDIQKAEYLYHCALESILGHIAMLQLAHLYLNKRDNGKIKIKEAVFWLERAATLDSDLVDIEKINTLKNNNSNTVNPLPLYESSSSNNKDDIEVVTEVVAPPRVQSLPFMKDRLQNKTNYSNNSPPVLTPQINSERRKSLASVKIDKKYSHNHSYSYSYGTASFINTINQHNPFPSKNISEINVQLSSDNVQENFTESHLDKETEYANEITENEIMKELEKDDENIGNISQSSIKSDSSSNIIMSSSIIEDVSKLLNNDEESEKWEFTGNNYYERMKQKIASCKIIQFNLQVQSEACFILYELYKNGYLNILEKNLKLSKYYLNVASLNGSTKAMYYRGLYFSNSFEKTKEWITKAAEQNHLYSQILLTYWNLGGLNDQDIDEASALFWLQYEERLIQAKIWYVLASFYEEGISDILKPDEQESKLLYKLASCRNLPEAILKMERYDNDEEDGYESYDYYSYLNNKKKHRKDLKKNSSDRRLSRRQSKFEKRHSKGMMSDDLSINTNRLSNDNAIRNMNIHANGGERRNSISTYNTNVSEYRRGSITTLTSTEYRRSSISTNGNEYRRGSISTMASNGNIMSSRVSSINGNYTDTEGSSYDNYSTVRTVDTLKTGEFDINNAYGEVMERRNQLYKKNSILRKGSFLNITSLFDKHDHSSLRSDTENISINTIKGSNMESTINKYYAKNQYIASAILSYLNIPQALILSYPSQMASTLTTSLPYNSYASHTSSVRTKSIISSASLINPIPPSSYNINNLMRKGSISNSSNYQMLLQTKMRNPSKNLSIQSKSVNRSVNRSPDKIVKRTSHPIGQIIYTNDDNDSDSSTTSLSSDESEDEYNDNSDDTKKISNIRNIRTSSSSKPSFITSSTTVNNKNESRKDDRVNKENCANNDIYNSLSIMAKDIIYQNKKYSNSDSKLSTIESSEKQNLEIVHPIQKSKTVLGHKKNGSLNIDNFTPLKPSTIALSDVDSVSSYKNSEFSSVQTNSIYSHYPRSSCSSTISLNQLSTMKDKNKTTMFENNDAGIVVNKRTSSLDNRRMIKSKSENDKINLLQNNINNRVNFDNSNSIENFNNSNTKRNSNANTYDLLDKKMIQTYSFNSSSNILDTPIMNSSPSLSEQISEQLNYLMEKDSSDMSDTDEVIDMNDNNTEVSEIVITENEASTVDYSYDVESSNDYSYEDYSVFEKRTSTFPFNNMTHPFSYSLNSPASTSYDNNSYYTSSSRNDASNTKTISTDVSSSSSKSKLKSKSKKRSLLKMRSIINSFSTEKERANSLKKREELLNNTSFNMNSAKDSNKKVYLRRYSKDKSQSSTSLNLQQPIPIEYNSNSNANAMYNMSLSMKEPSINDNYSEFSKLHNKGFMKKSKELLKSKISKSKLLLHHKGSTSFNKSKHKLSREKIFMGKEPLVFNDSMNDSGEHNYIEENNFTYSSRHSSSSKNSRIYRHAQSLYDPNQDQLRSTNKLSELDMFKRTYSLISKNYTSEDNENESGNHVLLENDYIKAYSSAKPEDLYGSSK